MTESPADLVAVQHYVQAQTGLPWDALGIKHATPQGGGYHEGNDLLAAAGRLTSDYSKRESPRDRPGSNSASAFDMGDGFARFREITLALVGACQRGDPRTRDIREVIYTPNGQVVLRWDRLGIRTTGDSSHLTHTHTSFFRDSEGRRDDDDNFLGLLRELFGGSPMADADIPETYRTARNGDKWGYDIVTGAQPAHFLGSDSVEHTTQNVLHSKLDAILANTAADLVEDRASTAALQALTTLVQSGGGNLDIAPVLAAIQASRDATQAQVAAILVRQRQAADAAAEALNTP